MIPSGENIVSYVKQLSFAPWDVESIGEDEIVVRASSGDSKTENKLYVFKVSDVINDLRTFETDGRPRAVSYHNGDIFIAASKGDELFILKTDTQGKLKNKIIPKKEGSLRSSVSFNTSVECGCVCFGFQERNSCCNY